MNWSEIAPVVTAFLGGGAFVAIVNYFLKRRADTHARLTEQSFTAAKTAVENLDQVVDMLYRSGWVGGSNAITSVSSSDPFWEEINTARFKVRRDSILIGDETVRQDVELVADWLLEACFRADVFSLHFAIEVTSHVREEIGQYLRDEPVYRENKVDHYRRMLDERPAMITMDDHDRDFRRSMANDGAANNYLALM